MKIIQAWKQLTVAGQVEACRSDAVRFFNRIQRAFYMMGDLAIVSRLKALCEMNQIKWQQIVKSKKQDTIMKKFLMPYMFENVLEPARTANDVNSQEGLTQVLEENEDPTSLGPPQAEVDMMEAELKKINAKKNTTTTKKKNVAKSKLGPEVMEIHNLDRPSDCLLSEDNPNFWLSKPSFSNSAKPGVRHKRGTRTRNFAGRRKGAKNSCAEDTDMVDSIEPTEPKQTKISLADIGISDKCPIQVIL